MLAPLIGCVLSLAASPEPPAIIGSMAPRLTRADDSLLLSWLEPTDAGHRLRWSRYRAGAWSGPRSVVESDRVFANWADVPSVVEGGDGALYAHWLRRVGEASYAYHVQVLRSVDEGATWTDLGTLHDDASASEHGFVSFVPDPRGVRAFWLDGRDQGAEHAGHMALYTGIVGDEVGRSMRVDKLVCDCCNTSAAQTSSGAIVAYRDRTEEEIRDIVVAGAGRTEPGGIPADGWRLPACPVNGPAIDAAGRRVVVAWLTGAGTKYSIRAAFSEDAGGTFGRVRLLDFDPRSMALGRVDVMLDEEGAYVSWVSNHDGGTMIVARHVAPSGALGPLVEVAPTSGVRDSGFPQMERLGDEIVFVWRDTDANLLHARAINSSEFR
jgi:hypothetical protein